MLPELQLVTFCTSKAPYYQFIPHFCFIKRRPIISFTKNAHILQSDISIIIYPNIGYGSPIWRVRLLCFWIQIVWQWISSSHFILQQWVTILARTSQTKRLMSRSNPFNPAVMSTCKLRVKTEKQSMSKTLHSETETMFPCLLRASCSTEKSKFCFPTFPQWWRHLFMLSKLISWPCILCQ